MNIHISGKQVDVGDSLRAHIEGRLEGGISKYMDRVTNVNVVISRESHMFRVDITGNTGTHSGMVVKGRAQGDDVYLAFDGAADKIEKQLRRYKRRLTNHHRAGANGATSPVVSGKKYVLADDDAEAKDGAPVVIAEKATQIETLTVSEAVMRMDLADLPALMFFNSAHGRLNIVYRRADGNISWVDPEGQVAA